VVHVDQGVNPPSLPGLGIPNPPPIIIDFPQPSPDGMPLGSKIAAGNYHSLAVEPDGTVRAWGLNTHGQVGDGTLTQRSTPVQVFSQPGTSPGQSVPLTGIAMVAAGSTYSLALSTNGTAWGWGQNNWRQISGPLYTISSPYVTNAVQVCLNPSIVLSNITSISGSVGGASGYAVLTNGTVWDWGYNGNGQLGIPSTITAVAFAQAIPNLSGIVSVAGGGYHALALTTNGTVMSWGNNSYGQLGNGTQTQNSTPTQIPGLTNIVAIAAGAYNSYALDGSGTVWAWGRNVAGQLGLGTTNDSSTPMPVTGLAGVTVTGIAAGYQCCLALASDGNFWAWGHNAFGQLGDGTQTVRLAPVHVSFSDGSQAGGLASGAAHSLSIQTDGTLRSWGMNIYGELGRATTNNISPTPAPVSDFP
jgi:alpha-tubulin suppressor-like RCC1 family protein